MIRWIEPHIQGLKELISLLEHPNPISNKYYGKWGFMK
jgi:hypothetical protein